MAKEEGAKDWNEPTRRFWRKGDRAKVSLLQVFRSSYWEHDARKAQTKKTVEGEEVAEISRRSKQRREGISENTLRVHLQNDLNALLNTIRLDSASGLEDSPHVADSIVNYGFRDLSSISQSDLGKPEIVDSIRKSLIRHEPRLIAETVEVKLVKSGSNSRQRMSISISAEMMGDPVDIPVDFEAEVDLGAGKLALGKLQVHK